MLASSDLVAFVATTDLARARDFYEGTLGLDFVEQNGFACVFRVGATMLRVTRVEEQAIAPYAVLGWAVSDIVAEIRELTARGVIFYLYDGMDQDADGVWIAPNGDRVAWFPDPDGNTLSLTTFAK